ncbi:MAG: hypothetical protein WBP42_06975 [Candidatus Zixiibacteriota bacterium]
MKIRRTTFILAVLLAAILTGCSRRAADAPFDGTSGVVESDHKVEISAIAPEEIKLETEFERFGIVEHLVFLAERDTMRRALTVTLRRALNDNKYIRAERDFSGFIYNGSFWQNLPYTKARHDSTRLDIGYDFPFGGLTWEAGHSSGRFHYDWRGVKFDAAFSNLTAVQSNRHGDHNRRAHAIGKGMITIGADTLEATVLYEMIQLENYNPVNKIETGIEYTNYDWVAVVDKSGKAMIASSDSTTAGDKILKSFVAMYDGRAVKFAEGASNVRINSDGLQRDHKIHDMFAFKKSLSVAGLAIGFELQLVEPRIFYSSGYALSVTTGTVTSDGKSESAWGIIEHWQQPASDGSVLR